MVVGEVAEEVDVLVVGGGPGGYTAALRLARAGRQVTLVERDRVGGTCVNVGCIPSKALLEVAAATDLARRAAPWGVKVEAQVDMAAVSAHVGSVAGGLRDDVARQLADAGVTIVHGSAAFTRADRAAVDRGDDVLHVEFRQALVATGSVPAELGALPFDGERVIDSTAALSLTELPPRMAIVGGGYIGCELATAFARLGSGVTIVELRDRLLPELQPAWLGQAVGRGLRELGATLHLGTKVTGREGGALAIEGAGGDGTVPAELVVVAVGRRPATQGLGLERAGVALSGSGRVVVGPDRRATERIWAIGDLTDGPALAHKATAEAEVAAAAMCGEPAAFDPACIPQVVFSEPEVVTVGATAEELAAGGVAHRTHRYPLAASGRARTMGVGGAGAGSVQVVADAEGTVLGVHMAGPHVSELAGEAALAIEMAATLEDLAATIHPHPTLSEALMDAAAAARRATVRSSR